MDHWMQLAIKIVLYGGYAIIVFGLLILFHELGHFAVAKLSGVRVYEFSLGFGPRLTGMRRGDTAYNIRSFPLGGFVRMAGMDAEEDEREAAQAKERADDRDEEGRPVTPEESFMHKRVPVRMGIIAAGPLMNFLLAVLLFMASFWFFGKPTNLNVVGEVLPNTPAAAAGLQSGDRIVKINNKPVSSWQDLTAVVQKSAGRKVNLEIKRDSQTRQVPITPQYDKENKIGVIGIKQVTARPTVMEAARGGLMQTKWVLGMTFTFLGKMIAGQMPVQLSGPVRITYELGKAAETGFTNLLSLAAFLSLQIGLFNLLPFPALDGSRIMFLGLEGVRGTPVDPSKENMIHLVGLVLLLVLMVVITYKDIVQMAG